MWPILKAKPALLTLFGVMVTGVLTPSAAQAQARRCLVTASSAPAVATYDPFNPAALSVNSVQIKFVRSNGPGGAKPSVIDMFVKSSNASANGIELIPISVVGAGSATGLNQNIFFDTPGPTPNISVPLPSSPAPRILRWTYSGNNDSSDEFTVLFNVRLPPNLDLSASTSLNFDIEYGCNGTGGGPPFSERATAPNAFTIGVTVLSALQASFVGSAIDFGEVGDKTDADITAVPIIRTGHLRVASSGVYSVNMTSERNYRMTFAGGNQNNSQQSLGYQVTFVGQTRGPANATAILRNCGRAGVPLANGQLLPIEAKLLEGGKTRTPASQYRDTLTVTLTPLLVPATATSCL